MTNYRIVECDSCGKSRRDDIPNSQRDPVGYEDAIRACVGWIHVNGINLDIGADLVFFRKKNFCSMECLKNELVPENFKPLDP